MVFASGSGPASMMTEAPGMGSNGSGSSNVGSPNSSLPPVGKRRRSGPFPPSNPVQSGASSDISMGNASSGGAPSNQGPFSSSRLNAVRNSTINLHQSVIPAPSPTDSGKLAVILDVDETLIHSRLSSAQEQFRQAEERKQDVGAVDEFTIELDDGEIVHVNKRPGLDQFLKEASEKYELFAFTAGLEEYARPLLDWLDPNQTIFRHRLYRDSCLFMRGYYLKDLKKVNRPLNRCVLVDNNAFCFLPQLSNGVPISSFYDDPNDTALQVLLTFLDRIQGEQDVRPFLRKSFNLENLLKEHREQIVG